MAVHHIGLLGCSLCGEGHKSLAHLDSAVSRCRRAGSVSDVDSCLAAICCVDEPDVRLMGHSCQQVGHHANSDCALAIYECSSLLVTFVTREGCTLESWLEAEKNKFLRTFYHDTDP